MDAKTVVTKVALVLVGFIVAKYASIALKNAGVKIMA